MILRTNNPFFLIVLLAGMFASCRSTTTLPDEPGYSAIAANSTADLSSSGELRSRLEAIVSLMDRKSAEMSALSTSGNGALEPIEKSYVKLALLGFVPTIEKALEDGEDAGGIVLSFIPRLENQRRSIERIRDTLALRESESPLKACKTAIAKAREISGLGSSLPYGAQTPRTGAFVPSQGRDSGENLPRPACGRHKAKG